MKMYELWKGTCYSNQFSNYLQVEPLVGMVLLPATCCWPFPLWTCTSTNSTQKQICLMSRPIEAIAEINV